MTFVDRSDAGRQLARRLTHLRGEPTVVLGLPCGGIPVAYEVAASLHTPLDLIVVRKLGAPSQPELAMGAIGEEGVGVVDEGVVRATGATTAQLATVEAHERAVLERRTRELRAVRPREDLDGRTAVVVDDGIATGATARAACQVARAHGARRVVLAVPVAPRGWQARLGAHAGREADTLAVADELVCVEAPERFFAIGQFYEHFSQVSEAEVVDYLERAHRALSRGGAGARAHLAHDEDVTVLAGSTRLDGHVTVPEAPMGMVIFARCSVSRRDSPRTQEVAEHLDAAGIATLLVDLLTEEEARVRANVLDVELLGHRLVDAVHWCRARRGMGRLPVGFFGTSTGAGAALWAAAELGASVAGVVSRAGRPDLAGAQLPRVGAPTLLIVDARDDAVLAVNRQAQALLHCENRLVVVPGATRLFEEPGTAEAAATATRDWFVAHLPAARRGALTPTDP